MKEARWKGVNGESTRWESHSTTGKKAEDDED
jgi:hypothetical protein